MRKSKRAKACDITHKTKVRLWERDEGCIFCQMGYYPPPEMQHMFDAMHYIPRSRGGLGTPENAAIGCRYHHQMMDQSSEGRRPEMLGLFAQYLKGLYPEWDESKLIYDKWGE